MVTSPVGLAVAELDTPVLCVDLDRLDANIARMAALCRTQGKAWRPHAKGHKSPDVARRLLAAGALGLTCAKLGEAEVFARHGIRDLLIANQVVGPHKVRRLVELRRGADPIVAVDHVAQAQPLGAAMAAAGLRLRVIIEVDVGLARAGVAPGAATLALARQLIELPGIEFAGLMGYEGHLLILEDQAEKAARIRAAMAELDESRRLLEAAGIACPIVSAGGTGSYSTTVDCPGVTELQAGGLIFMDAFYRHRCQVAEFDFALWVEATVTSRPTPERAIIDAGRKTMHGDLHVPLVRDRADLAVTRLSAEHGELRVDPAGPGLAMGDRVALIPGYGDFTTVLHDEFLAVRGGVVEAVWPIEARGKLR